MYQIPHSDISKIERKILSYENQALRNSAVIRCLPDARWEHTALLEGLQCLDYAAYLACTCMQQRTGTAGSWLGLCAKTNFDIQSR
ncbi:hypothetical protein NDU88_003076 [Pleurodeles waltl]|uniref:Uncharacterized protein n=1 Tax=Pleurodeles waltl TaxID=8319 RepID=A0AAV7UET1_PLEWA|nr:hypothetical protein NDU88_003076 [Pleurodeles waltl]